MGRRKIAHESERKSPQIRNILRDGTELKDIKGHRVKKEDAPMVYKAIEQIERRINGEGSQARA